MIMMECLMLILNDSIRYIQWRKTHQNSVYLMHLNFRQKSSQGREENLILKQRNAQNIQWCGAALQRRLKREWLTSSSVVCTCARVRCWSARSCFSRSTRVDLYGARMPFRPWHKACKYNPCMSSTSHSERQTIWVGWEEHILGMGQ